MTNSSTNPYQRLDVWETLKAHVLDHVPRLLEHVPDKSRADWKRLPLFEAQLFAAMVLLDLDVESSSLRRQARSFLKELKDEETAQTPAFGVVRESSPTFVEKLTPTKRKKVQQLIAAVEANPPGAFLADVSGPQAAVRWVGQEIKHLNGLKAHRWLVALGYPMAVPDAARQRFLMRMGWMGTESGSGDEKRAQTLESLEVLAHEVGATLSEINLVLGAFCGSGGEIARQAARCLGVPKCPQCPLAKHCTYYRLRGKEVRSQNRSLVATTRKEQRPRERLAAQGPGVLSDEELLAIILRTGGGGLNAIDLAQQILREAGTFERLAAMSVAELARFPGMGEVKAITIKAALEMARRLKQSGDGSVGVKINSARRVFERLRPRFIGATKEEFLVLLLNTKLEITREVHVSTGTLNQSLVHPREVFSEAIRDAAHAVIFIHNHPSGDPEPSREDFAVTNKLVKAGEIMGIQVLDHIIIGRDRYYSFADEGKLTS